MWGQIVNPFIHYLPWVSFIAGLTGSLHCVGMCGGLATYSSQSKSEVWRYQFGRLLAYLLLGSIAAVFGSFIHIGKNNPKLMLIPGLFLGALFLFWGFETLRGKRAEIPMPKFFSRIYSQLFQKLISHNDSRYKSFLTGLLSIFLPCGVLYSVVLAVASLETKWWALSSMIFFWMGTLPAMVLAPNIIRSILNPMKSRVPKIYATILIVIGLSTIGFRVTRFQELNNPKVQSKVNSELNCH